MWCALPTWQISIGVIKVRRIMSPIIIYNINSWRYDFMDLYFKECAENGQSQPHQHSAMAFNAHNSMLALRTVSDE